MAENTTNSPFDDSSQLPLEAPDAFTAAEMVRAKVSRAYGSEPDAGQELAESEAAPKRSKHQQFMYDLSASGKDLATIQTEWHAYYQGLRDEEKHQVWQEFYASQSLLTRAGDPQRTAEHKHQAAKRPQKLREARSADEIQAAIRDSLTAGGQLEAKHHVQSLLFGLGMGFIVLLIFLFGFFNEVVIAPFIQPSRTQAATPLIISSDSVAPTATPEVIIPKINVEIPVNYDQTTTDENAIENSLESGVVHYPTTVVPGETGNAAFFGHSSNNIFNKGKYKFAFVLLHTLVPGDTFYLTYNTKVYVYKVISRQIVEPDQVGVLGPVAGQTATATLITCDPPGTSLHRLVVVGQQISPDPGGNTKPVETGITPAKPKTLVGNGPTLWARYIHTWAGKLVTLTVLVVLFLVVTRSLNFGISRLFH